MAPSVLTRVIGPDPVPFSTNSRPQPPTFRPGLLLEHRRHRVKRADYPAVRPCTASSVRGTLVDGLTDVDLRRLDIFEGQEYQRQDVRVKLLPDNVEDGGGVAEPLAYGGVMPTAPPTGGKAELDADGVEWADTQTYIWVASINDLEEGEWDFDQFRREKLHLWAGSTVQDEGMREVDRLFGTSDTAGEEPDGTRGRGVRSGEFEKAVQRTETTILQNAV